MDLQTFFLVASTRGNDKANIWRPSACAVRRLPGSSHHCGLEGFRGDSDRWSPNTAQGTVAGHQRTRGNARAAKRSHATLVLRGKTYWIVYSKSFTKSIAEWGVINICNIHWKHIVNIYKFKGKVRNGKNLEIKHEIFNETFGLE